MRGLPLAVAFLCAHVALAASPKVTAKPELVVLGTDKAVEITVTGDGAPLHGFAAIGQLERDGEQDGDAQAFRWTPPDIRHPTTALLLFWSQAETTGDVAVLRVPLVGRTDLKISTEPNAKVEVQVQERRFGPVRADSRGRAAVPIEVPPDVRRAKVFVDVAGTKSTREAAIDVPSTNPLAAAFASESIAADGLGTLIVVNAQGVGSAQRVATTGATATPKDSARDVALYSVKPDGTRAELLATVSFGDFRAEAKTALRPAGSPPPQIARTSTVTPFLGLGAFAFGGSNFGSAAMVGVGARVPSLPIVAELELGFRGAGMSSDVAGLGRADSRVFGVPISLAARYRFLQAGKLRLDGRLGAGVIFFEHTLTTEFQPRHMEFGVRPEFFGAVDLTWRLGSFEPFAELRAEWNQIRTPTLFVRPGGAVLMIGTRLSL